MVLLMVWKEFSLWRCAFRRCDRPVDVPIDPRTSSPITEQVHFTANVTPTNLICSKSMLSRIVLLGLVKNSIMISYISPGSVFVFSCLFVIISPCLFI